MIPSMNSQMGMPEPVRIDMPNPKAPAPLPNQNQHSHEHGHQCKHHNHKHSLNPFHNVPPNMRVFVWNSILNGDFFFSIFLRLPMMGQGYYLYQMAIQTILYPIYQVTGLLNQIIKVELLRRALGGLAIYYFLFNGLLYYLKHSTFPEEELINCLAGLLLFLYAVILVFPVGYWSRDQFQELIERKPDLIQLSMKNRNICLICNIPKVARSSHCIYCQRCVKKFELHSMFFNTCIGVYNQPLYLVFNMLVVVYFIIILRQFTLPRRVEKSYSDLVVIVANLYQLHSFAVPLAQQILRISFNLTMIEMGQWRRYAYLWTNQRGQFGNPFDKGVISNWLSFWRPLFSSSGSENWATWKILNATDIPGHPLSELAAQAIQDELQKMRKFEKIMMRTQLGGDEEKSGLLEQQA